MGSWHVAFVLLLALTQAVHVVNAGLPPASRRRRSASRVRQQPLENDEDYSNDEHETPSGISRVKHGRSHLPSSENSRAASPQNGSRRQRSPPTQHQKSSARPTPKPAPPSSDSAELQWMLTQRMRQSLLKLHYTKEEVGDISPDIAKVLGCWFLCGCYVACSTLMFDAHSFIFSTCLFKRQTHVSPSWLFSLVLLSFSLVGFPCLDGRWSSHGGCPALRKECLPPGEEGAKKRGATLPIVETPKQREGHLYPALYLTMFVRACVSMSRM